ncbi:MAG: cytochrome c-type biogenesis protein CcmE [Rickettsiales bacterium]|jgi:cytochrome c-type biogenesis protein CcmE
MKSELKKSNPKKRQRIKFILLLSLISLFALIFIVTNFRSNIVFFYSPSELFSSNALNQKIIRVGGLVKEGSVEYSAGKLEFIITDYKDELKISYLGIKPDLFREKQGMIAKGTWNNQENIFIASELLAKHDEQYMPPEVAKAMKRSSE